MFWNSALTQLCDVLAGLYTSETDSRRVVLAADMDPQQIEFSAKAITNWQAILEEAQKQAKVEALIGIATRDYPNNQALQAAAAAYREWSAQSSTSTDRQSGPTPKNFRQMGPQQKMQLVDALLQCQSVSNRQTRDTVVDGLPTEVKYNIQRSANDRVDVMNIVTTALHYSGGLESFIDLVRMYESNSFGMQEVDHVLAAIA